MTHNQQSIRTLDLHDDEQVTALLALQLAAYRIEADLIGYAELPPLRDTLATLKASDEIFFGYFLGDVLAGATSYKLVDGVVDIHRLMVYPHHFHHGIAQALLRHLRQTAMALCAMRIIVATGSANTPACTLYQRFGFHIATTEEVVPGLYITHFALALS